MELRLDTLLDTPETAEWTAQLLFHSVTLTSIFLSSDYGFLFKTYGLSGASGIYTLHICMLYAEYITEV